MDRVEADPAGSVRGEVDRLCRVLEALVLLKKVKYRELDRLLGTSQGVTRRIFAGKIELKARHIFAILGFLDIEPKVFFRLAYEIGKDEAATPLQLLAHLQSIGPLEAETSALSRREVEALVLSMLESRGLISTEPAGETPKGKSGKTTAPGRRPKAP